MPITMLPRMGSITPTDAAIRWRTVRGYVRFAGIALRASPVLSVATATSTLVMSIAPLLAMLAIGTIVGHIPAVIQSGLDSPEGTSALRWGVALGTLFVLQWGAGALQDVATNALGQRVDFMLQRRLMGSVMAPTGLRHLEDPDSLDLINVGRESFRAWLRPGRLATHLSALVSARSVLLGSCVILAGFRWPVAVAVLAAALWAEREAKQASRRAAAHHYGESRLARRTEYYYDLGVTPAAAKEVRIFGLPAFLMDRFNTTWKLATAGIFTQRNWLSTASSIVLGAVAVSTLSWVCVDALRGDITLGAAVIFAQALVVGLGGVRAAADSRVQGELALATLERYEAAVHSLEPLARGNPGQEEVSAGPQPEREIRFEGVSFRYPGSDSDVLRDFNLVVPAGRSLAVVGANGAGKTTMIKLLCGFYEPTGGRIVVDGIDVAELDMVRWRRQVATVFQDFVRYEMTARANVGLGAVEALDDLPGIEAAAADAGALEVVTRLPRSWDTILSSDYAGGSDLSGGEWQKIALARALFALRHGAGLLVLDEPAANLDARAEAALYERFLALTEGITTIVISHRFSTVRQASSIVVLRDGRVAERGSHDELMAQDGHYAEMFRMQATRFSEAVAES
jgi:ATP-binding cassette, subfamily B, bacterial